MWRLFAAPTEQRRQTNIFTEHKLAAFTAPVSALPDAPRLTPTELKARFDASPEELRQKHNAACDAAEVLDTKVEGIVAQTYEGTIHESMLDAPLGAKLNAKAEKAALTAEQNTRAAADTALGTRVDAKCEVVFGTYKGNSVTSQFIALGFTPKAVIVMEKSGRIVIPDDSASYYGGLALRDNPAATSRANTLSIAENGFTVFEDSPNRIHTNNTYSTYHYIAFR